MVEETLQTCIKLEVENVEACAKVGLNKDTEIESIISLFLQDLPIFLLWNPAFLPQGPSLFFLSFCFFINFSFLGFQGCLLLFLQSPMIYIDD